MNNLSDIHLHTIPATAEATSGNSTATAKARARIAGDLSKEELVEIDIPEILFPQHNGITVTVHDKSFRLRTTPSKNADDTFLFVRVLPSKPPPIEAVGATHFFENIIYNRNSFTSGLILAAGRAGSGKSTFIASVLQHCVSSYPIHIVSIEDPVEYVLEPGRGYATQTEISFDSPSFKESLRGCMRKDPNILFIGEVRDKETAETALLAAESGHLVFGTIHAGSNAGIVDRLMGLMEGTNPHYTAQQISQCLRTCLSIERSGMMFRYIYTEITESLRNIIRERKLHQWDQYAVPEIIGRGG